MRKKDVNTYDEVINYLLETNESEPSIYIKQLANDFYNQVSLIVPEESLIKIINIYGGIDVVIDDVNIKLLIADLFKVNVSLINFKVKELYNKEMKRRQIQTKYAELDGVIKELRDLGESLDDIYNYTIYFCMEVLHGERKNKQKNMSDKKI